MVKLMSLLAFGLSFFLLSGPNEEAVTSANTHNAEHLPCALRADGFPTAIRIAPPTVCPLQNQFKVTSGFGQTVHPITKADRFHEGMDFSAPLGTPVLAGGDGVVVEAGDFGNYGLRVIIAHDEIYQTLYAHLSVIDVKVGQTIKAGDTIGKVGNTGVSTGPHLHYEVHKNGSKVDPKAYIPSC